MLNNKDIEKLLYKKIINKNTIFYLSKYGFSFTSSGSIFLNFTDEKSKRNGCKKNCSFCYWKKYTKRLCPTNSEIEEYLKYCWGENISLSGGGDPLFNFSKNKTELARICNCLHSKGRKVELISTEWDVIDKELHFFIKENIDKFAFSIQEKNLKLLQLLKKIEKVYGKENIRIIKIYNKKESYEQLLDFINYYKDYVKCIYIRENYYDRIEKDDDFIFLKEKIQKNNDSNAILSRTALQLVLVGNEIFDIIFFDKILNNRIKL